MFCLRSSSRQARIQRALFFLPLISLNHLLLCSAACLVVNIDNSASASKQRVQKWQPRSWQSLNLTRIATDVISVNQDYVS